MTAAITNKVPGLYDAASEVAKNTAAWMSTKASAAYAFAGDAVAKIKAFVAPFFASFVQKASSLFASVKTFTVSSVSSAKVAFDGLPTEAKIGVGLAALAVTALAARFLCCKAKKA